MRDQEKNGALPGDGFVTLEREENKSEIEKFENKNRKRQRL
jgi:hypothetical protein